MTTLLQIEIKSLPNGYLKELYKRLDEQTESQFSVVFNATFRTDDYGENMLSDYDSGLIITGYVISVDETFGIWSEPEAVLPQEERTTDLMMTNIKLLTKSITYIGCDSYQKRLYINF